MKSSPRCATCCGAGSRWRGRSPTWTRRTSRPRERRPYIKMGQIFGCSVEAVFFDVPLDVCRERNRRRGRVVPEDVLDRMAEKLVPPSIEEGFSTVLVVRD